MTIQATALVIDDEPDILQLVSITLERMDIHVKTASNLKQAYTALASQSFNFCLTDMRLPDGNGLELIEHIQKNHKHLPVAMMTAYGNAEAAVTALKSGAFDFVSKPVDIKILRNLVQTALKLNSPNGSAKPGSNQTHLIGSSPAMDQVRKLIARVARSQAPVMISGASGTGKELAAKMIHEQGPVKEGPFVAVNCGAIPSELMESEFFGHKKGSFTGAIQNHVGLFVQAHQGTLFLDEVADLPLAMQVKLLRAIQEKKIRPIGATQETPFQVRILSASHKPILALVENGQFREDLFYRLNVIEISMPALTDRQEDIPELAHFFLEKLAQQWQTPLAELHDDAMKLLLQHEYAGNVRELENILERAMTLSDQTLITPENLQLNNTISQSAATVSRPSHMPLTEWLEMLEAQELEKALSHCSGHKTQAAEMLGMSFRSFRYRLKKLGLE